MTRVLGLLSIALTVGCVRTVGPVVRDFHFEGNALIVNRCLVEWSGTKLELVECSTERQQLAAPASNLPVTLDSAAILQGVSAAVRDGMARCGTSHRVAGQLKVSVTVAPSGRVVAATPSAGDEPFAACVVGAFGAAQFARSQRGVRVDLPFTLPPLEQQP